MKQKRIRVNVCGASNGSKAKGRLGDDWRVYPPRALLALGSVQCQSVLDGEY